MASLFFRSPRLLILTIGLIVVAGLSSIQVTPRMEDPLLTERFANIHTLFPGAAAERVESLVTEKIEDALREIEEVKELRSLSRTGVSTITVELRDQVVDVEPVWSRIRDRLSDVAPELPQAAREPDFEQIEARAFALIVALKWDIDDSANYALLRRLAEELEDQLRAVPGTEQVKRFGDPREEVSVEVDAGALAALGMTAADVAAQLESSDAKIPAGSLQSADNQIVLDVDGELDSLERVGRTPIRQGADGQFTQLSDIARIDKGVADPPSSLAIIDGRPAVALGVLVRAERRIDQWSRAVHKSLDEFAGRLPSGIAQQVIFDQNRYVSARFSTLGANLLAGGLGVLLVVWILMGWRSAIVVGAALPLSALMVLFGLRVFGIPLHQMSVTGLILALGLLIDNAIVMVDEVAERRRHGASGLEAVSQSVRHLAIPLFGSTLTTCLAFGPIALMNGAAGEFVGSIAISVILAVSSSLLLAMTVVPALAAIGGGVGDGGRPAPRWWRDGWSHPGAARIYRQSLEWLFRRPLWGLALGAAAPLLGLAAATQLPEQFFPPADRDQCQIELELPSHVSLQATLQTVLQIRERLLQSERVEAVHWFVGESAPSFYYNIVPRRRSTPRYAQALVQFRDPQHSRAAIHQFQRELDEQFPGSRLLVRQLEQGPPFDAPVELRLFGPDLERLQELGDDVRAVIAATPDVIHTRADLSDAAPKLVLRVDEESARLAGLDHASISRQLSGLLDGVYGGSVLEATEELPIRVRVADGLRGDLNRIESLDLIPVSAAGRDAAGFGGIPLSALAKVERQPELAAIPRLNGRRMNEVQAFTTAGVLPAKVLERVEARLAAAGFALPAGYSMEVGGEAAKRDEAIGNLMASVSVLLVLMVATLVLSFRSFRLASLIGVVAVLSVGLGCGSLWVFGFPFGFMAIVGTMGLIGVAINDSIVVLAALQDDDAARRGEPSAVAEVIVRSSRHVVATSLTTIAGFLPLILAGGGFWPPLAVAIAGGVGGATILALYFVPSAHRLLQRGAQSE